MHEPQKTASSPSERLPKAPKTIASTQSLSSFVKSICDIMRRSNCASALQYVPELTWILFLRILDAQETRSQDAAEAVGKVHAHALRPPYRWQDWAAPYDTETLTDEGRPMGWKRESLRTKVGDLFAFINKELLPYLHGLDIVREGPNAGLPNPSASPKQRVIGRIMTAVERVRVDSETDFANILDLIHQISIDHIDDTHFFTLSQVYEDLLLKMGEKNSDGGQFFTPREVVRAMVRTLNPQLGETVYDPCCGTGGFLAQAYDYLARQMGPNASATELAALKHHTFYGREKENLVFPIALANLVLHGIDQPNLWHGNTLSGASTYDGLFEQAPSTFDVLLTNPPFGGKEGRDAQKNYSFESSSTQVLFMQHMLSELKWPNDGQPGGRCAVVLDEGFLFRTNESAFVETKRKLLDECNLWCIVSLPGGVFSTAGAGVKTNLLFFTKGQRTERIWYYDLSHVKVGRKTPMTLAHFGWGPGFELLDDADLPASLIKDWQEQEDNGDKPFPTFARLLAKQGSPERASDFSWTVNFAQKRAEAKEKMAPQLALVEQAKLLAVALKDEANALKKAGATAAQQAEIKVRLVDAEKSIREAQAAVDGIDAALYDLKAVNPKTKVVKDERTPGEVLQSIAALGSQVDAALMRLHALLQPMEGATA